MQKYKRNIKIGERGMGHSWQFLRGVAQYTLQYSGLRQQLIDQSYLTQYSEIFRLKLFWVWIILNYHWLFFADNIAESIP